MMMKKEKKGKKGIKCNTTTIATNMHSSTYTHGELTLWLATLCPEYYTTVRKE